jgi:hypothetical protein
MRFLADLQAGMRPSIESALDTVPTSEWPGLLESLLIAEVNWRRARGETPTAREYMPRFPAHTSIVRSVLSDVASPLISLAAPTTPVGLPHVRTAVAAPAAIVLPHAFETLEPAPPRKRRRSRKRLILGGLAVLVGAGVITVLSIRGNRKKDEAKPATDRNAPIVESAKPKTPSPFDSKPMSDPERELAEWVIALGGRGTLAMDAGGRRPYGGEAALPKARFAVAGVSLPPEAANRWNAADLRRLHGRVKLESIELYHPTALSDAALEPLAGLPLRTLDLRGDNVQVSGAAVAQFKDLETLALYSVPAFNDTDLTAVGQLSKLKALSLNSPKISPAGMGELKGHPLRSIVFGESVRLTAEHTRVLPATTLEDFEAHGAITDDALLEFAVFPNMKRFDLRRANISDAGFKVVAGLGKLEEFRAVGSSITRTGLEHLSERKALKALDLSGAQVGDDAISNLLALPFLQELRLAGCPVTDRCVMFLANIDGLQILDLDATGITDTALGILKKHSTLKSLIITNTKVSTAAIRDFEQATPNCKVVSGYRK